VRGVAVEDADIEHVTRTATPPRIVVAVTYRGRWYQEDRDTQDLVAGSRDRDATRVARWTFELTDAPAPVWRLARVDEAPADR
jgi:predicted lipid-binding transport protein (Tim44 family)